MNPDILTTLLLISMSAAFLFYVRSVRFRNRMVEAQKGFDYLLMSFGDIQPLDPNMLEFVPGYVAVQRRTALPKDHPDPEGFMRQVQQIGKETLARYLHLRGMQGLQAHREGKACPTPT